VEDSGMLLGCKAGLMFLFPCLHTIAPASWWFQKPKFWGLLHPVAVLQNGNEENAAHLHRQD
jgi:hypothetical protein